RLVEQLGRIASAIVAINAAGRREAFTSGACACRPSGGLAEHPSHLGPAHRARPHRRLPPVGELLLRSFELSLALTLDAVTLVLFGHYRPLSLPSVLRAPSPASPHATGSERASHALGLLAPSCRLLLPPGVRRIPRDSL